jgi:hypothetical protein
LRVLREIGHRPAALLSPSTVIRPGKEALMKEMDTNSNEWFNHPLQPVGIQVIIIESETNDIERIQRPLWDSRLYVACESATQIQL